MHNFTSEELVQFLYNETSAETTKAIQAALNSNWSLREELEALKASQSSLDNVKLLAPRKDTLKAILNYAEKSVEALPENA